MPNLSMQLCHTLKIFSLSNQFSIEGTIKKSLKKFEFLKIEMIESKPKENKTKLFKNNSKNTIKKVTFGDENSKILAKDELKLTRKKISQKKNFYQLSHQGREFIVKK